MCALPPRFSVVSVLPAETPLIGAIYSVPILASPSTVTVAAPEKSELAKPRD